MFECKSNSLPLGKDTLRDSTVVSFAFLTSFRLAWINFQNTNALAYFSEASVMREMFYNTDTWANVIKLFLSLIYEFSYYTLAYYEIS
jgi:hypothetical protein